MIRVHSRGTDKFPSQGVFGAAAFVSSSGMDRARPESSHRLGDP
jgi:hypothetical protein